MSNILAFKMSNGDEIVAEVIETLPNLLLDHDVPITAYKVRRPHALRFLQQGGTANLAFVPWTLSNPTIESMIIPASAVLLTFAPSANVENQYLSQTSGLDLSSKSASRISI